jgi:hypothetical protein
MNANSRRYATRLITTDTPLMSDKLSYSTQSEASVGFKLSFILRLLNKYVYNWCYVSEKSVELDKTNLCFQKKRDFAW